jgi:hypothetical protein
MDRMAGNWWILSGAGIISKDREVKARAWGLIPMLLFYITGSLEINRTRFGRSKLKKGHFMFY